MKLPAEFYVTGDYGMKWREEQMNGKGFGFSKRDGGGHELNW